MNRREFLRKLKEYLDSELPDFEVKSHIEYYDGYFDQRISEGATEEDVLKELEDPRLIAKTLINTSNLSSKNSNSRAFDYEYNPEYDEEDFRKDNKKSGRWKDKFKNWLWDVFFGNKSLTTIHKVCVVVGVIALLAIALLVLKVMLLMLPIILLLWVIYIFVADRRD